MVSVDGTHLGQNIPDGKGNRYQINLSSISGNPKWRHICTYIKKMEFMFKLDYQI